MHGTWHKEYLPYPTYIYLGDSHIKPGTRWTTAVATQHQPREHCINDIIIPRNINILSHTITDTYLHLSSHAYHQRTSRPQHINCFNSANSSSTTEVTIMYILTCTLIRNTCHALKYTESLFFFEDDASTSIDGNPCWVNKELTHCVYYLVHELVVNTGP